MLGTETATISAWTGRKRITASFLLVLSELKFSYNKDTLKRRNISSSICVILKFLDVGKVKRGAFAAGRKITRIISFSKKKPPRPGDPRVSYSDPRQGQTPLRCRSSGPQVCRCITYPLLVSMQATYRCWLIKCGGSSGVVCAEARCTSTMTKETHGPVFLHFPSTAAKWCRGLDPNIPLPSESYGTAWRWLLWR